MVRDSSAGRARNSYWPMPFREACRITITNEGTRRVGLYYHVDWEKVPSLPPNTAYFHAWYRQALPAPADGKPWVFLDTAFCRVNGVPVPNAPPQKPPMIT